MGEIGEYFCYNTKTDVNQTSAKIKVPITIVEVEYTLRVSFESISEKFDITQKYESFA